MTQDVLQDQRVLVSVRKAAERFRRAREEAGLTLRELGEKAGLAPSTIQKIENSKLIPSLAVCIRLADALHRSLSYFAEDGGGPTDVRFVPRRTGRLVQVKGALLAIEHVAAPLVNPKMEAFLLTVAAGGRSGPEEPIIFRGEAIVVCVKGRLRFEVRGEQYLLRPGDVLHFKGDIPHAWESCGTGEAQMFVVCAFAYER